MEKKTRIKHLKSAAVLGLLIFTALPLMAEEVTISMDSAFLRTLLIAGYATLVVVALIALLVRSAYVRALKGKETATDDGRDTTASTGEFWKILIMGAVVVFGVFVFRFDPYARQPTGMMEKPAEEVRDFTEIPDDQIVLVSDQATIDKGVKMYDKLCAVCHGDVGQGGAGPNLTDDYWLHGGTVKDMYKIITKGAPATSMVAWETKVTPQERLGIIAFIRGLRGSNPAGAKGPEGDLWDGTEGGGDEAAPEEGAEGEEGADGEGEEGVDGEEPAENPEGDAEEAPAEPAEDGGGDA